MKDLVRALGPGRMRVRIYAVDGDRMEFLSRFVAGCSKAGLECSDWDLAPIDGVTEGSVLVSFDPYIQRRP